MMLFDTHCHYDAGWFDGDRDALLTALPQQGVELILNPGCNLASSRKAVEQAERYPFAYAAVGVHPSDAGEYSRETEEELRRLAAHPKVKAIGEIGLDYYREDYPSHEVQQNAFRAQLGLAQELNLPVIVHNREAHGDTLAIVREFPKVRGVYHCYSGSLEDAKTLIGLGWNLSFTGSVTYKNAKKAPEVLAWLPEDRFMLETDAPYMLPYPRVKGERRNDSTKLIRVAERIAAIRGMTVEEVVRVTNENGRRFFAIP